MTKLATEGHEVHAIVSKNIAFRVPGITVHPNESVKLYHPMIYMRNRISSQDLQEAITKFSSELVELICKRKLHLVHAFYPTFTATSALIGKWLCGTPYVVSSFGRDITMGCLIDSRYKRMANTSFKEADGIIASNEHLASRIAADFHVRRSKISAIPMGVDTSKFRPCRSDPRLKKNLGVKGFIILMIASDFHPEKGFETLMAAIPLVRSEFDAKFVVIGTDASPGRMYQKKWEALARELKISDSLMFLGRIPHDSVPEYIATSDIVVDPRTSGAFSSSVLEALASGKPVVASDCEWIADVIQTNRNGLLFQVADERELAVHINSLLRHKQLRNELGNNAFNDFPYEYTLDACVKNHVKMYEKVLARS
jgi:glycosyltransferase involved in cell wall biosynthesis